MLASEVRNRGPAIEESSLDRIFDPLHRGSNQIKLSTPMVTSGRVCTLCVRLPRLNGGEIAASSDETETGLHGRVPPWRKHTFLGSVNEETHHQNSPTSWRLSFLLAAVVNE